MNDQTINRKLARAIQYAHQQMKFMSDGSMIVMHTPGMWHKFSYMDWRVIGPIAQRYDCFPRRIHPADQPLYKWSCAVPGAIFAHADTPQKAIALAVIAAHEAGVLS